jgi:uncharacterized protein (DUF1697 family)
MPQKIAILRGINVGGKRIIKMADLNAICTELGWSHVSTYIQSGNVFFDSDISEVDLEFDLDNAIKERFGYDVSVIVRSKAELTSVVDQNPFLKEGISIERLLLTLLKTEPSSESIAQLQALNAAPDRFEVHGEHVYLYVDGKYHQSKLTNNLFEKKLGVEATTRNWNTILRLVKG